MAVIGSLDPASVAFVGDPFERIRVYVSPLGGTRVEWSLSEHFHDPTNPYTYQLQTANSAAAGEADWINVGLPVSDAFFLEDDTQRIYGKVLEVYYRIVLTTSVTTYRSRPAGGLSAQDFRDWRISRYILQQERKRSRYTSVPTPGYLLKERRYGPKCSACADTLTEQPTNSHCPVCYSVGIEGGYFPAVPCTCDLGLDSGNETQDNRQGTVLESTIRSRFAGQPSLNSRDVFVSGRSGRRWIVDKVFETAAIREAVLVEDAEMHQIPFTHVIYTVPINA